WMPPCLAGGAPHPSRRGGNSGRRSRRRRGGRSGRRPPRASAPPWVLHAATGGWSLPSGCEGERRSFASSGGPWRLVLVEGCEDAGEASGPIQKFVSTRGTFRYELRNLRTTSNSMFLVPLLNPKFATAFAAQCARTSGSGH